MSCKKDFYFIASLCADESGQNLVLSTNKEINTNGIEPYCLTMRVASCARIQKCIETLPVVAYVDGKQVKVLNKYGTQMKGGEFAVNFSGCIDRRFTYYAYVSTTSSSNSVHLLINNTPSGC